MKAQAYRFKALYSITVRHKTGVQPVNYKPLIYYKMATKFITTEDVVQELIKNPDYKENIEEILTLWFEKNKDSFEWWQDWFNGNDMTKYN